MGELAKFLRDLRQHPELGDHFFEPRFLNNVATVLEKRGYEEVKLTLWDTHLTTHQEKQATVLLDVISHMEAVPPLKKNRALAAHLIRNMDKAQEHRIRRKRLSKLSKSGK